MTSPLESIHQEIAKCNRCGYCQAACPVYQVTRLESSTARGHLYQMRALLEGQDELGPELLGPLSECLLCRACVPHCVAAVQTDQVVVAGRAALGQRFGRARLWRTLFRHLLLNRRRLALYARVLAAGQGTGLSRLAGPLVGAAAPGQEVLPQLPARSLWDRLGEVSLRPAAPRGRVAYFLSCGFNLLLPEVGQATLQVLVDSGYSVEVRRNYCCGLPPFSQGDLTTARRLARGNIRLLRSLEVEAVVTDCASCSSFLKSYPRLLSRDPTFGPLASQLAGKVQDMSEFLARRASWDGLGGLALTVTYHDPCHASRYQGLREEPRRLLRSIPGLELVEMEEADWCCGGAGTYHLTHPRLSQRILDRKMENVARTGAQALATSCPSCIIQLSHGARQRRLPVRILHVNQLLAVARGLGRL